MITDSPRRCPRCSKRMVIDVGQATDPDQDGQPVVVEIDQCWSCGFEQHAPRAHPFDWHRRVQTVLAHNYEVTDHAECGEGEPCRATRPGMA